MRPSSPNATRSCAIGLSARLEVSASATIRALNRSLGWQLPTDGPKTLNGLLVEKLETLPEAGAEVVINDYQFEVLQIGENTVRTVRARKVAPATAE